MTEIKRIIDIPTVEAVRRVLEGCRRAAIVCHMTPDGDAMGSSLGLMHVLRAAGVGAWMISPDMPVKGLTFLPGAEHIVVASRQPDRARHLLRDADTIFCMDFNALHRIDRAAPMLEEARGVRVLIDHHLHPEMEADIIVSHPESSSTCALLWHLLWQAGWEPMIGKEAAECIYAGMMTDTGNFSYNSNDPDLYLIIASLLGKGIDKDRIYQEAMNTNSASGLRLCGYALYSKMHLLPEYGLALMILTREELDEFGYVKGDTEGLVNRPLSIPGVVWSVFIRQDEDSYVKISMRSKGQFAVNHVCADLFGGGGHLNAAGGEYHGPLEEAVAKLLEWTRRNVILTNDKE